MWNMVLLPVLVSVCWRIAHGNFIDICENKTLTTNYVYLHRTGQDFSTNCWCQIQSETGTSIKVLFNVSCLIGQQYKFSVSYGNYTQYFENRRTSDIFYTISESEEITLKLEEHICSVNDGLEFGIQINSNRGNINMTCYNPTVLTPELCTQNITTERPTCDITTKSPVTVSTTKSPVAVSTTKSPVTVSTTKSPVTVSTTKSPVTVSTTKSTDTEPTTEVSSTIERFSTETSHTQNCDTCNKNTEALVAGLIGGLISCIIVVIVLIIVIVCLVRRQHQKEEFYGQPSTDKPSSDEGHTEGYTDLHFTPSRQKPARQ